MNRIIVGMDRIETKEALMIAKQLKGKVWGFKLRRQIFDFGMGIIDGFKEYGNVMTDFKFYDINSAIEEAVLQCIEYGANITTVHLTACWPTHPEVGSRVAGVTILTSMSEEDYNRRYHNILPMQVLNMSFDAVTYNYGYIVCSAQEVELLKGVDIKKITPGIRPAWFQLEKDDQKRTTIPYDAIKNGSDLLVMSRPILNSKDIVGAVEKTNEEIMEFGNFTN